MLYLLAQTKGSPKYNLGDRIYLPSGSLFEKGYTEYFVYGVYLDGVKGDWVYYLTSKNQDRTIQERHLENYEQISL